MTGLAARFDPIEYAKQLRIVTKHDLAELKLELIKWMFVIGIAGVLAIAELLKYIH